MEPLFVFCADLHLEDGAWTTRPGIYGDAYYSFDQIVDYCIAHNLPLILGGDVLEKKQNLARPIAKLCDGLSRMQAANVRVYYIQGNHEYDRNAPWLSVHPWPIHMHDTGVQFGGACVGVWGLDWLPRGEIQEALKQVPADTDILITHQVWKDFMGTLGRTECELTDVHYVQTVLAGDFHVTKTVESVNAQGQRIEMLSPGSTAMQDMGEAPEKFFFVICADGDRIVFEQKPLKTRRLISHRVETQNLLDELCAGKLQTEIQACIEAAKNDGVPEHIQKPLVRVKFDKNIPDAYLRVVTCVGEQAHLFCEAIAEKAQPRTIAARDAVKNDLVAAVGDLLGDTNDAYKLAAALLAAEDPAREIDALFQKYMNEEPDAASEIGSEELGTPQISDV
ncbi:MAG: hypothetical protein EBZ69_00190 [Alphaproteobacteria bacterium]|nr:hypothetical protein [Alphaproteobacteria bacterium]